MTTTTADATVVTNALLKVGPDAVAAQRAMEMKQASVTHYALKEVRHGPYGNFVYAHEVLVAQKTVTAAQAHIGRLTQLHYKRQTALEALTGAMTEVFRKDFDVMVLVLRSTATALGGAPSGDEVIGQQVRLALEQVLLRAHEKLTALEKEATHRLSCFTMLPWKTRGDGTVHDRPRRCSQTCALGGLLAAQGAEVNALIDVVAGLQTRPENVRRLRALQWVAANPGASPSIDDCRALGDAVYALLCPAGGTVVTTNLADHAPLTQALGKHAKAP